MTDALSTSPETLPAILATHASEANSQHEIAHTQATIARGHVNLSIQAAVLCGKALIEAKALLEHGRWLQWLAENCPKIGERTARKYMAIANRNHDSDLRLDEARGLRHAYILAGIINEPAATKSKTAEINWGEHHKPDPMDTIPLDGREIDIEFEGAESFEVDPIHQSSGNDFTKLAEGLRVVLKWQVHGGPSMIFQKTIALGWVLGVYDTDIFPNGAPSLTKMAKHYGVHPTSVSRFTAEVFSKFGVHNRAQSHGDGVRK